MGKENALGMTEQQDRRSLGPSHGGLHMFTWITEKYISTLIYVLINIKAAYVNRLPFSSSSYFLLLSL